MGTVSTTDNPFYPRNRAHVLVVGNANSPDSLAVARYYADARRLPPFCRLTIECETGFDSASEISVADYLTQIAGPILAHLAAHAGISIVCLCGPGVPLKIVDVPDVGTLALDSCLAYAPVDPLLEAGHSLRVPNPYYGSAGRFYRAGYANAAGNSMVLVTRLDGPSRADALALVDRGKAARPYDGRFVFRDIYGYIPPIPAWTSDIAAARAALSIAGYVAEQDTSDTGQVYSDLMGFCTAGPYSLYSAEDWAAQRFLPGALAIELYSFSATSLALDGDAHGVAQLIRAGVTGVAGAVDEPTSGSIPTPSYALRAYRAGLTLSEAFWAGLPNLRWRMIVIGDPLCAPYANGMS